ncbi:MAG: hypothetical protein VX278_00495 [Myxococcota bacterium]|nr:hypothetical protein [Myxococcota bacterium]
MIVFALGMSVGCLTEIDPVIAPETDASKDAPQQVGSQEGVPRKVDSPDERAQPNDAPRGAPQDEGDMSKPPPTHPAVSIANAFLIAIDEGKEEELQNYLRSSARGLSAKDLRAKCFGVKEVTDLRTAPDTVGERPVQAMLKVEGEVVHTLGLSLERGQYRFAEFLTPSASEYSAAKQLWSK